ncbi:MAG: PD-(D/E)XK nuclease family protein [Anaerolineae bacterium]|nr:PD-(D/E)XK nuclease family protein [Anaerolineae bacterium]
MPATLITSAAGFGKTHAAIQRIQRIKRLDPFAPIWILLPTALQISSFRARLMQTIGEEALFGVEFFDFYTLNARILEFAGIPQRRAQDTVRFRVLRHVINGLRGELRHFDKIADLPGFISNIANFIYELKQGLVEPELFIERAQSVKDHDLGLIYQRYQDYLKKNDIVDREGEGWLALAWLQQNPTVALPFRLLVIDGYDLFTVVQAQLLNHLASRGSQRQAQIILTLTYQPHRASTAHRRFAQALTRLLADGNDKNWQIEPAPEQAEIIRDEPLNVLSENLFRTEPTYVHAESLTMLEAPDRRREVQSVLRKVKRLIAEGTPPDQIAIVARDLEPYTPYFLENAATYSVPLFFNRGAPLGQNPAVAAFLSLIDLARGQFRRRQVMDALRSPYLKPPELTPAQIDALDRISRDYVVVRWDWTWYKAIEAAGRAKVKSDEDIDEEKQQLQAAETEALLNGLKTFFKDITPPRRNTARQWIVWLERLIGADPLAERTDDEDGDLPATERSDFGLIERVRAGSEPDVVGRDLNALRRLKLVFAELLAACELVDGTTLYAWEEFRRDLLNAIDAATIDPPRSANRLGRVMFTSIYAIRGLPHDHLFVLGLAEGEFPAAAPEDPLYLDTERIELTERGFDLPTRLSSADESSLFYELTALARKTLTLVRPYMDDRGTEWTPSPYWRAVVDIASGHHERLPLADRLELAECAHPAEYMLALAIKLGERQRLDDELLGAHSWLSWQQQYASMWLNAQWGRQIERRRGSTAPHDGYTGRLTDPSLIEYVAAQLGEDRLWSASQLNDYGICPYRFFAKRLLKLEALEEPEEGMNAAQHGSLIHELLELTYRRIAEENIAIAIGNRDRALIHLNAVLDELLPDAPFRHGFRETRLWEQEKAQIRRDLVALVSDDFSEDSPLRKLLDGVMRYNVAQEVGFGSEDQPEMVIEGEAGSLRVRGIIDRVDSVDGKLIVVDYKTGSKDIPIGEMIEGRNVQMLIYLQAVQQRFPDQRVAGGAFWHVHYGKLSGKTLLDTHDESIQLAAENLHTRILYGRQGVFVTVPSKPDNHRCARYCEFHHLCRASITNRRKPVE